MEHTLKSIKHFSNIKIGGNFLSFFFPGGNFLLIFGEHAYRKAWTTSKYKSVKVENNLFEKVNQNNLKSNTSFSRSYDISLHDWNSRNIEHLKWPEESLEHGPMKNLKYHSYMLHYTVTCSYWACLKIRTSLCLVSQSFFEDRYFWNMELVGCKGLKLLLLKNVFIDFTEWETENSILPLFLAQNKWSSE